MFEEISFPEREYEAIQNYLNKLRYCYTTRVYKEIGKYKVGELYTAPWGDILKIDEVKTYWKVSERPFYDEMTDDEHVITDVIEMTDGGRIVRDANGLFSLNHVMKKDLLAVVMADFCSLLKAEENIFVILKKIHQLKN